MADKDIADKRFLKDRQNFADFLNGYAYQGKPVVSSTDIEDLPEEDSLGSSIGYFSGTKDVFKLVHLHQDGQDEDAAIPVCCLINAEIQSQPDTYITARAMKYHAMALQYQLKLRKDKSHPLHGKKLYPIHVIVLNYSMDRFNKPKSLKELTLDDGWPFEEPDYFVHQLNVAKMEVEETARYAGDIGVFFRFLQANYQKKNTLPAGSQVFRDPELLLNALVAHTEGELQESLLEELAKEAFSNMTLDYLSQSFHDKCTQFYGEGYQEGSYDSEIQTLYKSAMNLKDELKITFQSALGMISKSNDLNKVVLDLYNEKKQE